MADRRDLEADAPEHDDEGAGRGDRPKSDDGDPASKPGLLKRYPVIRYVLIVALVAGIVAGAAWYLNYRERGQYHQSTNGKIERTLFMLDWLENPDLRRRCHPGLNNSEQRHALTQAIYTFRQGRIIDRSHEAQQYRASGLNLVIAAIVIGTRSTWTPPLNICDQRRSRCLMIFLPYLPCWLGAYCLFGRFTPGSRRRFRWPQGPQSAAR